MPALDRATYFAPSAAADARTARGDVQADLVKLAQLHREASETAHLANLLGRAPYAAGVIAAAAMLSAAAAASEATAAPVLVWLMLILFGGGATYRAYETAIRRPFDRPSLAVFAEDFKAVLTYAGFAWGAGAFLVLPQTAPLLASALFVCAPPLLLAGLLRGDISAAFFSLPAVALGAAGVILRGLPDGAAAAGLALAFAAGAVAAAIFSHRRGSSRLPQLAQLPR